MLKNYKFTGPLVKIQSLLIAMCILFGLTACDESLSTKHFVYRNVKKENFIQAIDKSTQFLGFKAVVMDENRGLIVIQDSDRRNPSQARLKVQTQGKDIVVAVDAVQFITNDPKQVGATGKFIQLFDKTNQELGSLPESVDKK